MIRWARSATKHRIARARSAFVIEHCGLVFRVPPPEGQTDDRLLFLGDDAGGVALEVMAVELEGGGKYVIHAMEMRDRYRPQYEEARSWRI
jgi:hexokinase